MMRCSLYDLCIDLFFCDVVDIISCECDTYVRSLELTSWLVFVYVFVWWNIFVLVHSAWINHN